MKPQQAETVLNRFFEECGNAVPRQSAIEPVLDRVWERLEWRADEFVDARMPATPARPFRFVWAAGIVLVAVLVNVVVWHQGLPFSLAVNTGKADEHWMSKSSSQQAGETLQVTGPQDVFELASVKLLPPSSEAVKTANQFSELQLMVAGCTGGNIGGAKLDPGRLTLPAITVFTLVIIAYGQDCTLVEGGPAWARSGDYYEIQALLPAGTPSYKQQDLAEGNAPRLQRMLQNLLADRFRLVLKRELREMSVYTLRVATPGKIKLSPDETRPPLSVSLPTGLPPLPLLPLGRGQKMSFVLPGEVQMSGHAISMAALAKDLRPHAGRIVVDKTGFSGVFDYDLKFAREGGRPSPAAAPPTPQSIPPLPVSPIQVPTPPVPLPSFQSALADQLGLKLEAARMPIEVLVIESVERPSEN